VPPARVPVVAVPVLGLPLVLVLTPMPVSALALK
jgi:hypothetical protein